MPEPMVSQPLLTAPTLFVTATGNPRSKEILVVLQKRLNEAGESERGTKVFYLPDLAEIPRGSVALIDHCLPRGRHFRVIRMDASNSALRLMPKWCQSFHWVVAISSLCNPRSCANQLFADFVENFSEVSRRPAARNPFASHRSANRRRGGRSPRTKRWFTSVSGGWPSPD